MEKNKLYVIILKFVFLFFPFHSPTQNVAVLENGDTDEADED